MRELALGGNLSVCSEVLLFCISSSVGNTPSFSLQFAPSIRRHSVLRASAVLILEQSILAQMKENNKWKKQQLPDVHMGCQGLMSQCARSRTRSCDKSRSSHELCVSCRAMEIQMTSFGNCLLVKPWSPSLIRSTSALVSEMTYMCCHGV